MNRRDAETQSKRDFIYVNPRLALSDKYSNFSVFENLRIIFFAFVLAAGGCSLPSLEKPQCTAARDTVKRFYSFHFGTEMRPSAENLSAREPFLTNNLVKTLSASTETTMDYFTKTENYPKTFRVASCTSESSDKATLQVQLLWRDETVSSQKNVEVETILSENKWLINKVSN